MFKKFSISIFTVVSVILLAGCTNNQSKIDNKAISVNSGGKLNVAVSFTPLSELTKAIGGDKINLSIIIPDGTEPHDFEPKPRDMESIAKADVFIYNGLNMEAWVDKALSVLDSKKLNVVNASKNISVIKSNDQVDPHIWLSLRNAEVEAKNILETLDKADPINKEYYDKNYKEFTDKLSKLNNEYTVKLNSLQNKNFVTGHAAFAYLCRDYGLKQNSVEDVFADGEPTAKKLKELVDYCKENNIKTVFMEELASPKVSEALAKEVGASVKKIYTIESKEDNMDYLQAMQANLEMIYSSLK